MLLIEFFGQGSAGMAAAFALTNHPEKFHVTVFDKQDVCGGMATSFPSVRLSLLYPENDNSSFVE